MQDLGDEIVQIISEGSRFLDVEPADFLRGVGLMKAKETPNTSPGIARRSEPNALRGFVEDTSYWGNSKNIRENFRPIGYSTLREIERKNPVVSAITNVRCKQMRPFTSLSKADYETGFRIKLKDPDKKPTKSEKAEMQKIADWFLKTGRTDFDGADEREDDLLDVLQKYARDMLVIDQVAIELRRDRAGNVVDFWILDGATIRRVAQGGYAGKRNDFDPRIYVQATTELQNELLEQKLILIPEEMDEIAFVQVVNGRYVAAFKRDDLIFDNLQKRTDVKYHGYGYPPLEQAMAAVTAFLFSLAYNSEAFDSGTMPKIALAFKSGNFNENALIDLQDQWAANYRGIRGAWRIPMLNGEVTPIDLLKSPRDMEYSKYLEMTGSLICSVMCIDPQEIGMRWQYAQNVLSESTGPRLQYSKDRGLNDILGSFQSVANKIMEKCGWSEKYIFEFTGIEPEDAEKKSKLLTEAVKRDMTINESRALEDKEPDPYGDIILDPVYLQYRQGKEQAEQMQSQGFGAPGGAENVFEDATNEAIDDIFKAETRLDVQSYNNVKKPRTLLL